VVAHVVVLFHLQWWGITFVARGCATGAAIMFRIVVVIIPLKVARRRVAPMNPSMTFHALASPVDENFSGALRLPLSPEPRTLAICVITDIRHSFPRLETSGLE